MKSNQHQGPWSVQSVTHDDGRRAIALWRGKGASGNQSRAAKAPGAVQRKGGVKLRVQFASVEFSAFQPLIRNIPPARRRVVCLPRLQILNAC
jgi:hypothetical protein